MRVRRGLFAMAGTVMAVTSLLCSSVALASERREVPTHQFDVQHACPSAPAPPGYQLEHYYEYYQGADRNCNECRADMAIWNMEPNWRAYCRVPSGYTWAELWLLCLACRESQPKAIRPGE